MSASSCFTSTYCTLLPKDFSKAAYEAKLIKQISGFPPSRATNVEASMSASSIDSEEPSKRTPDNRVTSLERLTPQKLSDEPGAVRGSQAASPDTFLYWVVAVIAPATKSP